MPPLWLITRANRKKSFTASDPLPFSPYEQGPSATAHSSLLLKKIQNTDWGNEFYWPILTPSTYWQRHGTDPRRLQHYHYLNKGRGNEFYSLWCYLQRLLSVWRGTLYSHVLLKTKTACVLSSLLSTFLPSTWLLLSLTKEGENQFYSNVSVVKYHISELLDKKGQKSILSFCFCVSSLPRNKWHTPYFLCGGSAEH